MKVKLALVLLLAIILLISGLNIYSETLYASIPLSPCYFLDIAEPEDLEIEGIGVGGYSKASDVLKKFGEPLQKSQNVEEAFQNPDYNLYWDTWIYEGLIIIFNTSVLKTDSPPSLPDKVSRIIISSDKYETFRGIKVGDPYLKVLEKYGGRNSLKDSYCYGYDLVWIEFKIKNGKVFQIILGGMWG